MTGEQQKKGRIERRQITKNNRVFHSHEENHKSTINHQHYCYYVIIF